MMNIKYGYIVIILIASGFLSCTASKEHDVYTLFELMKVNLQKQDQQDLIEVGLEILQLAKSKDYDNEFEAELLAIMLATQSNIHIDLDFEDRGVEYAFLAENILSEKHDARTHFDVLGALRRALVYTGEFESALPYAERLYSLYSKYLRNNEIPPYDYVKIIQNHAELAVIYQQVGRPDDAIDIFLEWSILLEIHTVNKQHYFHETVSNEDIVTIFFTNLIRLPLVLDEKEHLEVSVAFTEKMWEMSFELTDIDMLITSSMLAGMLVDLNYALEMYQNAIVYCEYLLEVYPMIEDCDMCEEYLSSKFNCMYDIKNYIDDAIS